MIARRTFIALTASCTIASFGCAKEDKDRPPEGCGFGTLVSADPPVAIEGPLAFDSLDGTAMNQVDIEFGSQVPSPRMGALRRGLCGTVGLAYRQTPATGGEAELSYVEILDGTGEGPGTPETVTSAPAGVDPGLEISLFYEPDCTPVILVRDGGDWTQHTRGPAGWTAGQAGLDLAALTGSAGSVMTVSADTARDGRFHLFGHANGFLVHGSRSAAAGAAWTFTALDPAPGTEVSQ